VNRKTVYLTVAAFGVFLASFFGVGPWLQHNIIEPNQPYLIIDPEIKSETGCEYDYLTYVPIEITGTDLSKGIRFPITTIPTGYLQYVHYPDSWNSPWNPWNPANKFATGIQIGGYVLVVILGVSFIIYLVVLWRKGALKKMADKISGKDDD
jgi:hypothetical protein